MLTVAICEKSAVKTKQNDNFDLYIFKLILTMLTLLSFTRTRPF